MTESPAPSSSSDSPPSGPWVRLRAFVSHPFVYQRMIRDVSPDAKAGDVVTVIDKSGRPIGQGFYHDRSQIALRVMTQGDTPLDEDFFRRQIDRAVTWREQLFAGQADTNACRLVHAEGDGISGLIAERYDETIVIEVFSLGIYRRLKMLKALLAERTGISRFVVRADERIERFEGFHVKESDTDAGPEQIEVREHGVRFKVDLRAGHKTGFFCDQRDNRRRLATLCHGADLLDVCCYTGGFGLYAKLLGKAETVTGVDLDEDAVALAERNAKLNQCRIKHVHADAFHYLRQMQQTGKTYDVVVLDPPKLVPTKKDLRDGEIKYNDLNALAITLIKPQGLLLTCSCSGLVGRDAFLEIVKSAAHRVGRPLQIIDQTGAAPDHPVMANCPESSYLKAVWARLM